MAEAAHEPVGEELEDFPTIRIEIQVRSHDQNVLSNSSENWNIKLSILFDRAAFSFYHKY